MSDNTKNTIVVTAAEYATLRQVMAASNALLRAAQELFIRENDLRAAVAAWERAEKKP